jgi:CRP-like cAMP-binding protein
MKRTNTTTERLRSIAMFSACTNQELDLVASRLSEHRAAAGEVLVTEGQTGRELFVIIEGSVTVSTPGRALAELHAGDFFGEIALLDDGPRTATVVAKTDVVLDVSSQREFTEMIIGAPSMTRKLLIGVARRLRAADLQLVDA